MADPNRIPTAMRERAQAIIDITDHACREHLDHEYGEIARRLIARLSRNRPSPLARGEARIWAAGVLHAAGQINFLFEATQTLHLTGRELAERLGVVQTTMANKAGLINRTLDIGIFEARAHAPRDVGAAPHGMDRRSQRADGRCAHAVH